jgi:hypothetical protein
MVGRTITLLCHTKKRGIGVEGCLWIYSRSAFQGPSPVRYESMAALHCGEFHRPLLCKAGNPTHPGPGIVGHHWITSTKLNASGVTRVR